MRETIDVACGMCRVTLQLAPNLEAVPALSPSVAGLLVLGVLGLASLYRSSHRARRR